MTAGPTPASESRLVEVAEHATHIDILLHRPEKRNALDRALALEFHEALASLETSVLPLFVRSATAGMFVAGTDLREIRDRTLAESLARTNARLFQRLADHPAATVAVVDGAALGGGMELALACDIRIATPGSLWGLPEVTLGLVPSAGGLYRLLPLVGESRARELILTGRLMRGEEAHRTGLVQRLAEPEEMEDAVAGLVDELRSADPLAVRLAKEAMRAAESDRIRLADALAQAVMLSTDGTRERITARLAR